MLWSTFTHHIVHIMGWVGTVSSQMDWERLPVAPLYADVRASCSHVKIYCKTARVLSTTLHSFIHSLIDWFIHSLVRSFIHSFHSFIHDNLSLDCKWVKSSRRSPCDHSVGFVNVTRVIFRPIKSLKLIGSWVPKKSANLSVVKRKFNSGHYNILHCLLRGGRVWSW